MPNNMKSNFSHHSSHSDQLLKLGLLAAPYFSDDPNTCSLKLRLLAGLLAQETAVSGRLIWALTDNLIARHENLAPDPSLALKNHATPRSHILKAFRQHAFNYAHYHRAAPSASCEIHVHLLHVLHG